MCLQNSRIANFYVVWLQSPSERNDTLKEFIHFFSFFLFWSQNLQLTESMETLRQRHLHKVGCSQTSINTAPCSYGPVKAFLQKKSLTKKLLSEPYQLLKQNKLKKFSKFLLTKCRSTMFVLNWLGTYPGVDETIKLRSVLQILQVACLNINNIFSHPVLDKD